ncbi:MAG TPA: hypothetical protein VJ032_06610, partial [Thermoanaerobaculia bacterium]|nr:hypothetical protein [Thermoanaerobaculia bacterium]
DVGNHARFTRQHRECDGRVVGAKVLGHFTGWETVISPIVMLIAIGFSGAVGVFFGYYPARKAAALNPIQALRYE